MPAIVRKFICSRLRALSPPWRGALTCCRRTWRRQRSSCCRTVCVSRQSNSPRSRSNRTITKTKKKTSRITKIILTMKIMTRTTKITSCRRHRPWITAMMTKMTMLPTMRTRTTKATRTSSSRSVMITTWHRRSSLPILTKASACRRCCWIWARTAMCAVVAANAA